MSVTRIKPLFFRDNLFRETRQQQPIPVSTPQSQEPLATAFKAARECSD